jgi:hypothetical protein
VRADRQQVTFGPTGARVTADTMGTVKRGIEASTTVRIPIERARQVLTDDPGCVVADAASPDDRRERRFSSALGIDLGAGGAVRQAVTVSLGALSSLDGAASLPLRWQASGRDRVFPVFEGELEARAAGLGATMLVVRGTYTVPLGAVGRFGDGVIGRRLAQQSLVSFVEDAAGRLDREVHRRMAAVSWHPAPYAVDLRETGSENYLG